MSDPGKIAPPPIAEGEAAYRQRLSAGFSQSEVDQWKEQATAARVAAGFKPDEIAAYWGEVKPNSGPLDRVIAGGATAAGDPAQSNDWVGDIMAGANNSIVGKVFTELGLSNNPVFKAQDTVSGQVISQGFNFIGDYPAYYAGSLMGGAPGAFALAQASREALRIYDERGNINNLSDLYDQIAPALGRTTEQGLIGWALGPLGKMGSGQMARLTDSLLAKRAAGLVTQYAGMTAANAGFSGQIPTWKEMLGGAIVMLGFSAAGIVKPEGTNTVDAIQRVAKNLQKVWVERGINPDEAIRRAKTDPLWRQEILAQDVNGEPVHPTINRDGPPEAPAYHQPAEPKPGPNGEPVAETGFRTNPHKLQDEHDAEVADLHRGAHIAVNVDAMLPLVRQLEGSGDAAISPAGAIGRFQIMPGTARQYGFDVAKLTDPAYNEKAARAILTDLHNRYHGNVDDILVAYNAGPGRANTWIAHGRRTADLPRETQNYLAHSDKINGWGGEPPGGGTEPPAGSPPADGGGVPPGEVPPERLSAATLEDIMHDFVGEKPPPESAFTLDNMYRQWVSELGPARTLDKVFQAEGLTKPGSVAMNTEDMFRQTYGSGQRAGYFVKYGTLDPAKYDESGTLSIGHTSDDSFLAAYDLAREAGGTAKGFDAYRIAKRVVEKAGQGIRTSVDVMKAGALVAKTERIYGPASKMMNRVKDASLDYARDSGVFSPEQTDIIKKYNEHHVTFRVLAGAEEMPLQGRGRGKSFRVANPVKEMQGGDYKIMDPLTADIDNLNHIVTMADRNRAIGHVIGAIEAHEGLGDALGLKKLPAPEIKATLAEPGSNVFKPYNIDPKDQKAFQAFIAAKAVDGSKGSNRFLYFRDGAPEVWEAKDPAIANLMRGADAKPQMDFITKTATAFARLARSGITLSPDYAPRLALRDQVTTAILDERGGIPFSNLMRGIMPVLRLDGNFKRWMANGGAGTALVEIDTDYVKRDIAKIMQETGTMGRLWNTVSHPIQFAQLISERIDAMPRVGHMMRNEAELGTLKAATAGRKAYLDFPERGTSAIAQWLARITPFMSANTLGLKQTYEAFAERPVQTMTKVAAFITLPTIGLYVLNYFQDKNKAADDPTRYDQLPRWQRDTMFIAPEIGGVRLRLSMPPLIGPVFGGMTNRLLDHFVKEDQHAFEDWGKSIIAQFMPPMIPTIALPVIEAATNHSFFSGKPLIPSSMEDASGPMQYTENTTAPARALANVIGPQHANLTNVSPIVLENFVREWAGTMGMGALKALNAPFDERGTPWSITDLPFVQSFVITNPGANSYDIQTYYNSLDSFKEAHADMMLATDRAMMSGDMSELQQSATPQAFVSLAEVSRALKMQRQTIIAINHNDKMTDDEKRSATFNVVSSMIDTAKFGLSLMDTINKGVDVQAEAPEDGAP